MLSSKISVDELEVKGKRVFLRVDFNVPLSKTTGEVQDANRVKASLPTIKYLLDNGAKSVVLVSHLGRPDGRAQKKMSLKPVATLLSKLLNKPVHFLPDCVGPEVEKACADPTPGTVFLLENCRFHPEEEGSGLTPEGKKFKPSKEQIAVFRKSLTKLGDIYVNDAFGTVHRAHSSITGVELPIKASGFLIKQELKAFSAALENPQRPFLAILGGAKVADKIQLIDNLLDKVDAMIIGGGMGFTFLKVLQNFQIGKSLFDEAGSKIVEKVVAKAKKNNVKLYLPIDLIIANKLGSGAEVKSVKVDAKSAIPADFMGLDHGPQTSSRNAQVIWNSKTIIFNGPQGVFENPSFASGTLSALQACAAATQLKGAVSIIGGGDTAAAANQFGFGTLVSHVSTGGGASLELLEGRQLPGIVALSSRNLPSKL